MGRKRAEEKKTDRKTLQDKRVVFFEKSSWYHRTKEFREDMSVKYSKKGGFQTPEEAEASYREYEARFQEKQRELQLSSRQNKEILFGDYLKYWFETIYSERIETTTRMIGAYTLYELILPSMEKDIKLRHVSVEYLDVLLKRVSMTCASAGNKGREFLSLAMKDALLDGYITYNPVPETKPYKRLPPKIRILSREKLKALLKAAAPNPWYLEILLALFCGLRKGEILGLKFEDFDWEKGTLRIQRQLVSNPKVINGFCIEEYGVITR